LEAAIVFSLKTSGFGSAVDFSEPSVGLVDCAHGELCSA
jgi:hypothetical protein